MPLFEAWSREDAALREKIDESALPFSNIWAALKTAPRLPAGSVLHLGILNSLRSWNFFCTDPSVKGFCNTGGFGIDGCASSLLGASLASPNKLFFGVIGDLAFFYDMNSIGNRHAGKNLRIMLVSNGGGAEFKLYSHQGHAFGDDTDAFIGAFGHYGNKSRDLVRHYAQDLGFEYLAASDKESFMQSLDAFVNPQIGEAPILFELFVETQAENDALKYMHSLDADAASAMKAAAKSILGEKGVKIVKSILKRD